MNIALFLSGGAGTRVGAEVPKQYIEAGGRPVFSYSLRQLACHSLIDAVQVVAAPMWRRRITGRLREDDPERKFRGFSAPGENRQLSILRGLEDILLYASPGDYVLIHDAARPALSGALVTACLEAAAGHDGAVPALPMRDTVYASADGNRITGLLQRREIFAGQAPEAFRLGKYCEANRRLLPERILQISGSAEPAVLAGLDIVLIPGHEANFKITTKADLVRFQELVERGTADEGVGFIWRE